MAARIIIDTDTASDDAVALLMAFKNRDVRVDAVTVVCGNVEFDQQVRNALYVVERFSGYEVPVYPGCRRPLVLRSWSHAYEVHGRDGMGNSSFPEPSKRPEKKHGALAIVELVNERPGEYTLVALGPLTNIALATCIDPELPRKVGELVVMGGSPSLRGNVTPVAEFNFWVDPDAAHVVMQSGFNPIIVGWDATLDYGFISHEEREALAAQGTEEAEFFKRVTTQLAEFSKKQNLDKVFLPDPLAMAIALDRRILKKTENRLLYVDRSDTIMRGATVPFTKGQPNARICSEADHMLFKEVLYKALSP